MNAERRANVAPTYWTGYGTAATDGPAERIMSSKRVLRRSIVRGTKVDRAPCERIGRLRAPHQLVTIAGYPHGFAIEDARAKAATLHRTRGVYSDACVLVLAQRAPRRRAQRRIAQRRDATRGTGACGEESRTHRPGRRQSLFIHGLAARNGCGLIAAECEQLDSRRRGFQSRAKHAVLSCRRRSAAGQARSRSRARREISLVLHRHAARPTRSIAPVL